VSAARGRRAGGGWASGLTLPICGHPARHGVVVAKVDEAAGLLQDNHELQTFLQSCREVGTRRGWWHRGRAGGPHQPSPDTPRPQLDAWVEEKMLTAQDASYGEAHGLHGKWQKHQAFMAELAPNQGWLEKIKTVGAGKPHRPPAGWEVPTLAWSHVGVHQ